MTVNGLTNGYASAPSSAATKLRRIVEDPDAFLMCPGVHDGYSARISLQVGFDGMYSTWFVHSLNSNTPANSRQSPCPKASIPAHHLATHYSSTYCTSNDQEGALSSST